MANKQPDPQKVEGEKDVVSTKGMDGKQFDLLKKVKNLQEVKVTAAFKKALVDAVSGSKDTELENLAKEFTANTIKSAIVNLYPKYANQFLDMDYDGLMERLNNKDVLSNGEVDPNINMEFAAKIENGIDGSFTWTSFQISPNSYWKNMTNILNYVTIGDNSISLGASFDAWETFYAGQLESGEAMLRTMGYPLTGPLQLNQNKLVPNNTQMAAGYQASLGIMINVSTPQQVGGGKGYGLFTMYAAPINVMKLATTQPQQLAEIVRIFRDTALNTKRYVLWMVCTMNFLNNISNFVVDNVNTSSRNCLNGTLFNLIKVMQNPTNEFNVALTTKVGTTSSAINSVVNYNTLITAPTTISNAVYLQKATLLTSPYLVEGSQDHARIQPMSRDAIHIITTPQSFVNLKSGVSSPLFHWEFQFWDEYVRPENVHLLYKTVQMMTAELNTPISGTETGGNAIYAFQQPATLGPVWIPNEAFVVFCKPDDINQWTANYYSVWMASLRNDWGAGQVATEYEHFAFGGGVIPWANGLIVYMKNYMKTLSDTNEPVYMDFSLGVPITIAPTNS